MIATILHSSSSFNAVYYNERKVDEGVASLLEIKNFGEIDTLGYDSPQELVDYLKDWSAQSDRIRKSQFHVAISCKGKEMSEQELLDFAHAYLHEMGYDLPGQPVLIYSHRDTDNSHLHIITSRVGPDGRKIDDHHERRKSQKVLENLTHQKLNRNSKEDINTALGFNFKSITQFKAILEAMSYECYQKDDTVYIKKGGMVQDSVDVDLINAAIQRNLLYPDYKNKPRYAQLNAIFKKYKNINSSRTAFENELKKKFGLSLVYFGSKDSPYGYAVVDFHNKQVLEGGKIMKVRDLLNFLSPDEHRERIESLIYQCFEENPFITTKDLNKRLFKIGAYIKKGEIIFGKDRLLLKESFEKNLSRNNRIEWLASFKPTSEEERNVICRIAHFIDSKYINLHSVDNRKGYNPNGMSELREILQIPDKDKRLGALQSAGFIFVRENGRLYAYNSRLSSIIDLHRAGIDENLCAAKMSSPAQGTLKQNQPRGSSLLRDAGKGGRGENREWEVGEKDLDEDDPDRKRGYSY